MTNRMYDVGDVPVDQPDPYGDGNPNEDSLSRLLREREAAGQPMTMPTNAVPEGQDSLSKYLSASGMLDPQPQPEIDPEVMKHILAMMFRGAP